MKKVIVSEKEYNHQSELNRFAESILNIIGDTLPYNSWDAFSNALNRDDIIEQVHTLEITRDRGNIELDELEELFKIDRSVWHLVFKSDPGAVGYSDGYIRGIWSVIEVLKSSQAWDICIKTNDFLKAHRIKNNMI